MARKRKSRNRDTHPASSGKRNSSSPRQNTSNVIAYPPVFIESPGDHLNEPRNVTMLLTPPMSNHATNTQLPELDISSLTPQNTSVLLSPLSLPHPTHHSTLRNLLEIDDVPSETPQGLYYRHLATKGRGSPLWIPEPSESLHIDYRRQGLSIGDVVMLTSYGGFSFLFNICHPSDHPYNFDSVPEGFSPLNPPLKYQDIQRYESFAENDSLTSDAISKDVGGHRPSGIHFRSSAVEGAILALPNGAFSEDLVNTASFERYIADNIVEWYRYAKEVRGWKINNGDLRVVVGVDKSSSWGMATFASRTEVRDVQLRFRTAEYPEHGSWEYEGMVNAARAGPSRRQIDALIPTNIEPGDPRPSFQNQCLFVRTLNTSLQDDVWKAMESEGIHLEVPEVSNHSGYDNASSNTITGNSYIFGSLGLWNISSNGNTHSGWSLPHSSHPSNVINKVLLTKHPQAKLAITSDRDWTLALQTSDCILPSGEEIIRRLLTSYGTYEEDGIVSWKTKEMIAKGPRNDISVFSTPNTPRRAVSVGKIEDLPPYTPHMETRFNTSSSLGRHTPTIEVVLPPYRPFQVLSHPRFRSEGYQFFESPEKIESITWHSSSTNMPQKSRGSWPSEIITSALGDITMTRLHEQSQSVGADAPEHREL